MTKKEAEQIIYARMSDALDRDLYFVDEYFNFDKEGKAYTEKETEKIKLAAKRISDLMWKKSESTDKRFGE